MSAHALLAPSSAPQWGYCTGSVKANASVPDVETQESREGTAAHYLALDICLKRGETDAAPHLGEVTPDGVVLDEKMVEGAQCMIDDVWAVYAEHGGQLLIEHRVAMPHIHKENWGTLDAALYVPQKGLLFLWDYKHGHGIVDAEINLQLLDYLAGLMLELGINGHVDQFMRAALRIVQPFAYRPQGPVDVWDFPLSDARPHFNQLTYKAAEAMGDNPTFTTGKHCQNCKAVGRCEAARRAGYNYVDILNAPYRIDTMDGASLAVERQILAEGLILLRARQKAIEDDLKHRIKGGDASTGLALEAKFGHNKWSVPDTVAVTLASHFGVDIGKTVACTPTQAINKAPKEIKEVFETALKTITKREPSGLNLIKAKDSISHRAFKKV